MPTSQSACAATRARVRETVEVGPRREGLEALRDRLRGERRDPQPLHRFVRARRLVDVAKDELAPRAPRPSRRPRRVPPGRAGNDERRRTGRASSRPVPAASAREGWAGRRGATLPRRVHLVRLGERHEMANGPGDDPRAAVEIASPRERAPSTCAMSRATLGFSATTRTLILAYPRPPARAGCGERRNKAHVVCVPRVVGVAHAQAAGRGMGLITEFFRPARSTSPAARSSRSFLELDLRGR